MICDSGSFWERYSVHERNTSGLGRGSLKQLSPVRRCEDLERPVEQLLVSSSRWKMLRQLSLELVPWKFFSPSFNLFIYFLTPIFNKPERNISGNWRGERKLHRCVMSLKISLVCVLLYTFHYPPIMRRVWNDPSRRLLFPLVRLPSRWFSFVRR